MEILKAVPNFDSSFFDFGICGTNYTVWASEILKKSFIFLLFIILF